MGTAGVGLTRKSRYSIVECEISGGCGIEDTTKYHKSRKNSNHVRLGGLGSRLCEQRDEHRQPTTDRLVILFLRKRNRARGKDYGETGGSMNSLKFIPKRFSGSAERAEAGKDRDEE